MSINFPSNPQTGDIFVFNQMKWRWNGYAWDRHPRAEKFESTGILFGGGVTAAIGGTTFAVEAGIGQIVGYTANSYGVFPTLTEVTWGDYSNQTLNYLATSYFTRLYIDENGDLQQQTSAFDHTDPLNKIILGTISHIDRSTIALVTNKQNVAYDEFHRLYELFDTFGPIKKTGLVVSANGANLRLDRSAGESLIIGSNYVNNFQEPDTVDIDAQTPAVIARIYRDGSGDWVYDTNSLTFYTDLDPGNYDDGSGTLDTVNNNQWTIQRLYMFPNLPTVIMSYYGRVVYNSYSDAVAGIQDEVFTEAEITEQNAVFLGHLVIRGGAADLTTTDDATIIQSGFCRVSGGGGGAAGGGGAGAQVYYSDAPPSSPSSGDFWFESDTGSFYVYIDDGDSLQWVEVNGQPGPTGDAGPTGNTGATGPTGPSGITKYIAGFLYDGRGTTIVSETKTDVIRPIEQDSTVTQLQIRLPNGASGGTASAYVYKVNSSYVSAVGASLDADKTTVGYIDLPDGAYGSTGGTLLNAGLSAGDYIFGGVTGAGLTDLVQFFINYEA